MGMVPTCDVRSTATGYSSCTKSVVFRILNCMVITYSKGKDQPGCHKVTNSARGQLKRENDSFVVPIRAREFGLARRVRQSRPASACSSPYSG